MKTLGDWLDYLGWDATALAREADIAYNTAKKAVDGDVVSIRVARKIAEAISKATGSTVQVGDIRGLMIYHTRKDA